MHGPQRQTHPAPFTVLKDFPCLPLNYHNCARGKCGVSRLSVQPRDRQPGHLARKDEIFGLPLNTMAQEHGESRVGLGGPIISVDQVQLSALGHVLCQQEHRNTRSRSVESFTD